MKPHALAPAAFALVLAGCTAPAVTPGPPPTPVLPPSVSSTATPVPAPSTVTPPVTNDRGNIVKKLGEWAGMVDQDGRQVARFRVTKIRANYKCTGQNRMRSKNGNFIAITMEVTTTKVLKEAENSFWVTADEWKVISRDGTTANDTGGNSYDCLDERDAIRPEIGPGEHVEGRLILDAKYSSGGLVFSQSWAASTGWEWGF